MPKFFNKKLWIIGCGDIGRRVANLYQEQEIHAVVKSQSSALTCKNVNIKAVTLDLDSDYSITKSNFIDSDLFYFSPPQPDGKFDNRLQGFINKIEATPRRIVLISTTGVYGDSQGEWIDETTTLKPLVDRAYRRLSAEQALQGWAQQHDKEFMILRVPGIYAEDRLPLARLKKGLPVVNESEAGWTNRIHADDLAQACKEAMACQQANQIINVTDGHPSSMTDYFNQVADFTGLPRPPQISMVEAEQTLSEGMVSYLKESRRIRNDKMLALLNIKLKYPTLKTALRPDL